MAGTPVEKKLDLKYIIWVCIGLVLMLLLSVSVWYLKVNTNTYIRGGAHYAACKKRSVL